MTRPHFLSICGALALAMSCTELLTNPPVRRGENCGAAGRPATLRGCEIQSSTHADCGGSGLPVFGCELSSSLDPIGCRWFPTDCVPANVQPSACPSESVCCRQGTPYAGTVTGGPVGTHSFLTTYGTSPIPVDWNVVLSVDIDPALAPTPAPSVVCVDHDCGSFDSASRPVLGTFTVRTTLAGDDVHLLLVDVVRIGSSLGGRVCEVGLANDDVGFTCPESATPRAVCSTSGTITVSANPFQVLDDDVVALSVSAQFPGYTVAIDL